MDETKRVLFLLVILLTVLLLCVCVALVLVLLSNRRMGNAEDNDPPEESNLLPLGRWYIELWDIGVGLCFAAEFEGCVTLGRGLQGFSQAGRMTVGEDVTISRDQCMVYEQNGVLLIWNMSEVNKTLLNGKSFAQPVQIQVGDKLTMGRHVYLISALQRNAQMNAY